MPSSPASERDPVGIPATAGIQALALRHVHRAMAELRRGTPVLLVSQEGGLLVAAAEAVSARSLAEVAQAALAAPLLLLSPVRAAAVLHRPVLHRPATAPSEEGAVALRLPLPLPDRG